MKHWGAFLLLIPLAGCQDTRVTNLEKRVDPLEQTIHQLEADKTRATDEDPARRAQVQEGLLESCVAAANDAFERNMVSKTTKRRDGSYKAPVPVLDEMQRQKQVDIEECKRLYSK
jgi:hypothetical protein